jgi:hypothetical protein
MSPQHENPGSVRRVVLPNGRRIEIVYFDRPAGPGGIAAADAEDLHVCRACASPLVYPTDWADAGNRRWQLALRCPNCEWTGDGLYPSSAVERLDEELDRAAQALVADLRQLAHANMEEEIERFVAALDAGHVLPIDF